MGFPPANTLTMGSRSQRGRSGAPELLPLLAPCLGLLVLATACGNSASSGSDSTASGWAKVIFSPDAGRNSEEQVAAVVRSIELLLDSPTGFDNLGTASTSALDFEIQNPDKDDAQELLARLSSVGPERLPVLRMDPGSQGDRPIALRARGLDGQQQIVAYGESPAQPLFSGDEVTYQSVPFNLAPSRLPPELLAVTPQSLPSGIVLGSIAIQVSKPLSGPSLDGHTQITLITAPVGAPQQETPIAGTWTGPLRCPNGLEMWRFTPTSCLEVGLLSAAIRLSLDAAVTDLAGQPLRTDSAASITWTSNFTELRGFGPCAGYNCGIGGGILLYRSDLRCDSATGRLEAASCTVPLGEKTCGQGIFRFDWVSAKDDAGCQTFREDSYQAQGSCVIANPWPCTSNGRCEGIGLKRCDTVTSQCVPASCDDGICTDPSQVCVPGKGCLPRMGTCREDCSVAGGCPEFSQTCQQSASGLFVCQ